MARRPFDALDRLIERDLAADVRERLAITDRRKRAQRRIIAGGEEGTRLVDEPGGEHGVDAVVDAAPKLVAGRSEPDLARLVAAGELGEIVPALVLAH